MRYLLLLIWGPRHVLYHHPMIVGVSNYDLRFLPTLGRHTLAALHETHITLGDQPVALPENLLLD